MRNRLFIILLSLFFVSHLWSQSSDRNYIQHRVFTNESGSSCQTEVAYYDGLGKPIQGLSNANSSKGIYGVSNIKYDELGRVKHEWLSVPMASSCCYVSEAELTSNASTYYKDSKPYVQTLYDALDRPVEKYLPGEDWYDKGKSVRYSYGSNTVNQVRMFQAPLGSDKLEDKGFYAVGSLSMEKMTDEDGVVIETYKDISGNKVLERRNGNNDTYYIYNDRDELRFILPQGYLDASDDEAYDCFAYEYRYDGNGLCVWKKLPGCEPIKMWYDSFMRLAYSQDGNQRAKGQCLYKLYDGMGRISEEGLCPSSYAGTGNVGSLSLLTKYYYDNYSFVPSLNSSLLFQPRQGYAMSVSTAKGLLTGKEIYHLDDSGDKEVEVYYYDDKGNLIQTQSTNHLGGSEIICHNYSFTDKVIATYHKHTEEGRNPIEEETIFTYDSHTDKLQAIDHRIGEYELKRLVDFTYDDNGLLVSKNIAGIERLNYSYNLRQWLQSISGEYFNETLCYNNEVNGKTPKQPLYSGNISAMSWNTVYDSKNRSYDFSYDGLWRLTDAHYADQTSSVVNEGGYDTHYSYDAMGNMLRLTRNSAFDDGGFETNDDVTFRYHGNQLVKSDNAASDAYGLGNFHVSDKVNMETEYFYDANGNMTKDLNKGIDAITYNVLNLPSRITFTNGESIDYLYNSAGTLLQKKYYTSLSNIANPENAAKPLAVERSLKEHKDYCGNITYDGCWYNVLFDGGMAYFYPDSIPYYQFQVHDHQGNVRASLYWNGGIAQVSHYYPFGGLMRESYYDGQPYRYNGKELDRMYGLDWYDYGARMYDGAVPRWHSMDNHAEKNCNVSPYAYCHNNPVNKYDLDGNDDYFSNQGIFLYSTKTGSDIYVRNGRSPVPFRSLNLRNPHNLQVAANIVGHYARAVGIRYNLNGGTGKVGISTLHKTDYIEGVLAETQNGNIYMKMINGSLDEEMYNINNLRNTLKHENEHKLLEEKIKKQDDYTHMAIICNQLADEDFSKGSSDYQWGTVRSLIFYMNRKNNKYDDQTNKIWLKANHILRSLGIRIKRENNGKTYCYEDAEL